jgi:hypothetical protein
MTMRKKIPLLVLMLALPLAARAKSLPAIKITFAKNSVRAELAATDKQREQGLMFRTSLKDGHGMLFVFPDEQMRVFWMKNTLIDLDMVFMAADKSVTAIYADVPRSTRITPDDQVARASAPAQYVLELPAGYCKRHGLNTGMKLDFRLPAKRAAK